MENFDLPTIVYPTAGKLISVNLERIAQFGEWIIWIVMANIGKRNTYDHEILEIFGTQFVEKIPNSVEMIILSKPSNK